MKAGGRPLYEVTDGNVGRVMDMRWLKTDAARFRLVGVVNRLDRRDFHDAAARRLRRGAASSTGSPTPSQERQGQAAGVAPAVQLQRRLSTSSPTPTAAAPASPGAGRRGIDEAVDAGWLAGGPLDRPALTFRQLELNAQVVRFPSGQETEFGGQAAYLMRIFGIDGDAVTEMPLENTPDPARLAADAALKAELADYVAAMPPAIDLGVYQIPDEFLARQGHLLFDLRQRPRSVNHPFSRRCSAGRFCRTRLRAEQAGALARGADRAAGQRRLPGLPPGRLDGRLPFHRPRRQADVAAEPHRGRHLAASSRRAAAPRGLCRARSRTDASRTVSGRCPSRRRRSGTPTATPHYEPADAAMPCLIAGAMRRTSARPGHAAPARSARRLPATDETRIELAQCLLPPKIRRHVFGPSLPDRRGRSERRASPSTTA